MALIDLLHLDFSPFHAILRTGKLPTAADLVEFETEVGFMLPEEFRELATSPLGGFYLAPRNRPTESLKLFGLTPGLPAWLDIRLEPCPAGLIPFLQRGDLLYCFDSNRRILRERNEWVSPVQTTVSALLLGHIHRLRGVDRASPQQQDTRLISVT
jgi:hypothetical protein